jgi:hypothetical protein
LRRALLLLLLMAEFGPGSAAVSAGPAQCEFQHGFRTLHDRIPALVADCLEDEHGNPANGNVEQRTTGGLLVWRPADNWTAFTDGATTWINGPDGLVQRPTAGPLFSWEAAPPAVESGIAGQLTIGAGCPGSTAAERACQQRLTQLEVTVLDGQGHPVAQVRADARGHFDLALLPGVYTLHPAPGPWIAADDLVVTVSPGQVVDVTISYHSGIR